MKIIDTPGGLTSEFADAVLNDDWQLAYEIVEDLIKEGNPVAEHTMGWFHKQGVVSPKSDKEAFNWWIISAPKGVPESQAALGCLYLSGNGTQVNYQKAYYWLSLALENGESDILLEVQQAKDKLKIWQYLYIKLLLLFKT